jgi:hypothetical protein
MVRVMTAVTSCESLPHAGFLCNSALRRRYVKTTATDGVTGKFIHSFDNGISGQVDPNSGGMENDQNLYEFINIGTLASRIGYGYFASRTFRVVIEANFAARSQTVINGSGIMGINRQEAVR